MRASGQEFGDWLIQLGDGKLLNHPNLGKDMVEIPSDMLIKDENVLINHCFGNPEKKINLDTVENMSNSALLCPKNDNCLDINNLIVEAMPEELMVFNSIDSLHSEDAEEIAYFSTKFLNTLRLSGLPPHVLKLKVGAIIILLKNMDSRKGLCNGTRLLIRGL